MKMKKRHQQKLVLLSILLFFVWNVPFISIFDGASHFFGFPVFFIFIFISWALSIAVAYLILKRYYE